VFTLYTGILRQDLMKQAKEFAYQGKTYAELLESKNTSVEFQTKNNSDETLFFPKLRSGKLQKELIRGCKYFHDRVFFVSACIGYF
jgi:hypothetical protein